MELLKLLEAHGESDVYPMHMPGHKRNPSLLAMGAPCLLDITEIDGFDNLHNAEGILAEAMARSAKLWGARSTRYLINGSTSGLLIALSALCPRGGEVIVARNCHLAVWHAIELRELCPTCVMPTVDAESGVLASLTPEQLEAAFAKAPRAAAVVVTSPTYEGVVSDIASLAKVAHAHGAWLIVDEAHGAHLGFTGDFPQSAVRCAADVVIQSVHKTLPAFTQTALLHICNESVSIERIDHFSKIYQTSSPSYLLMASIDHCTHLLEEQGKVLFDAYSARLSAFYERVRPMKRLKMLKKKDSFYDFDCGKLYISTLHSGITGRQLYDRLRNDYHIQPEMATAAGCLCMTSIADTDVGFERLGDALLAIDAELAESERADEGTVSLPELPHPELPLPERLCTPAEVFERASAYVPFVEAAGQVSAEFVYAYPPDIPLLAPGERVDDGLIRALAALAKDGVRLHSDSGRLDLAKTGGGELKVVI